MEIGADLGEIFQKAKDHIAENKPTPPEVWVISYFISQDNTWMVKGILGRSECRAEVGRLAGLWPAVKHVSAVLQTNNGGN